MGFNSAAKKEAAAQQAAAYAAQQSAVAAAQKKADEYHASYATRNAGVIDINKRAIDWNKRYAKGTDIAELLPAQVKLGQQASDTVKNTVTAAGRIGDASQLPNDAGYHAKLNTQMGARMGRAIADTQSTALTNEAGRQEENAFNTTQFLNADLTADFNMSGSVAGLHDRLWSNARQRRMDEVQIGQMAMGNLFKWVSLGTGIAGGIFSAASGGGAAGGGGGAMSNIGSGLSAGSRGAWAGLGSGGGSITNSQAWGLGGGNPFRR